MKVVDKNGNEIPVLAQTIFGVLVTKALLPKASWLLLGVVGTGYFYYRKGMRIKH